MTSDVSEAAEPSPELAAWREFCRVLVESGEMLLDPKYPTGEREPVEGIRHLATSAACWLTTAFSAEQDLGMYRLNDLLTPWGGPNGDNVYRHAKIDDQGTYRLRGHMHSCEEFLLALRIGNMHQQEYGTLGELSATEHGIGQGGEVDILFSPSGAGGVAIPPGTRMIAIREYYFDWRPSEPATLILERVHGDSTPGGVVAALNDAGDQVHRSVTFWNDYMITARARGADNAFIPPRREPKGLQTMHYSFCFWSLQPDEALVVRFTEPAARYWSVQLYQLGWFEWLDLARPTSLNHAQLAPDADGGITVVLSAADPGAANWLDTQGRIDGLLTFRCAWLSEAAPKPTTQVVTLADLGHTLGPDDPRRDAAQRAEQIAARRAHLQWRFRA